MNPTYKPSVTPVKFVQDSGDGEEMVSAKKHAQSPIFSGSDEDNIRSLFPVADVSTSRTSGTFLNHMQVVNPDEKSRRVNVTPAKDALRVGEIYDIIDIQTVNTCHGLRQVWSLKGMEDTSLKKVFSYADLDQFTVNVDKNLLDQQDRCDMIKQIRVVHKELRKPRGNEPSEYDFDFLTI